MDREERVDLVPVQRPTRFGEVVHGLLRCEAEGKADVAELKVEIDDHDLAVLPREADAQVASGERLARAAFRAEHADQRREGHAGSGRGPLPPRQGFLHGELDRLGRLWERQDVVGARLEDPPDEPVGRSVGENEDRTVGPLLHGAVDQEDGPVRVARTDDHEEVRGRLLQRRPALLQPVDDPDDLDVGDGGERGVDDVVVDPVVDRDECSNLAAHRVLPNDRTAATGVTPKSRVSRVTMSGAEVSAPVFGRRTIQILPFSVAKAISAASRSLTFTVTFDLSVAPAPKPAFASPGAPSTFTSSTMSFTTGRSAELGSTVPSGFKRRTLKAP